MLVHSMERLARNLDDLRRLVQQLTQRGIRIEFVKECLSFTGEDSPMANLLLSVMGAFSEFERAMIRERQREGIVLAKQRGAYRGRKKALATDKANELRRRVDAGENKAALARKFGISRETLYQYVKVEVAGRSRLLKSSRRADGRRCSLPTRCGRTYMILVDDVHTPAIEKSKFVCKSWCTLTIVKRRITTSR